LILCTLGRKGADGRYSPNESYLLDVSTSNPFPISDSIEDFKIVPATTTGFQGVGIEALLGDDDAEEEEFSIRIGLREVDDTSETSFSFGGENIAQILTKSLELKSVGTATGKRLVRGDITSVIIGF